MLSTRCEEILLITPIRYAIRNRVVGRICWIDLIAPPDCSNHFLSDAKARWLMVQKALISVVGRPFVLPCRCRQDRCGTSLDFSRETALHRGKDFAVSPPLKEFVSVRTSRLTACGGYPLPCSLLRVKLRRAVFGLSSLPA